MKSVSIIDSEGTEEDCNIQDLNLCLQDNFYNNETKQKPLTTEQIDVEAYRRLFEVLGSSHLRYSSVKLQQISIDEASQKQPSENEEQKANLDELIGSVRFEDAELLKPKALTFAAKQRITNKIQQILAKRSLPSKPNSLHNAVPAQQKRTPIQLEVTDKRKKPPLALEMIEQFKREFEEYNRCLELPHSRRMTFKDIAQKLNVSLSLVTQLYDEHSKDPHLTSRINRFKSAHKQPNQQLFHNPTLAQLRIQFIRDLLKKNGPLSQFEIARQMSKDERLCVRDRNTGKLQPIGRRAVQKLMKVGNLTSKRKLQVVQMNFNDAECIKNRYRYAMRYMQLVEEKQTEIYFVGEYSFASQTSLSSCPPAKREDFCDHKFSESRHIVNSLDAARGPVPDRYNRKVQYFVVISEERIVYYQIYSNMFRDMHFAQTLGNIGTILSKMGYSKKYIIMETSFLHKKSDLQQFQKKFPIKVMFLPPLTPMLNPTEYLFAEVKSAVKSRRYKSRQSLSEMLQQVLKEYNHKIMQSFYTAVTPYVDLSIKSQPFK